MRSFRRAAAALLAAAALACGGARADTPIALFKSFAGNINFTGTQKTLRTKPNSTDACAVATSVTATLAGIPSGATVLSAQLYWAGSSSTPDYSVTVDGVAVSAPANRQYDSDTVGYDYFSGAADVTSQVQAKRNGNYVLAGLSINSGSPYCSVQGVLGGFQLAVIYSNPGETFRVLNLYEGFQYIRSSSVSLNLANFQIPSPIGTATGRVGHITWEGDATLSGGGEDLRYNGVGMVDATNTSGNQFNSASNINGDANSYGIDFDAYTVQAPVIQSGQTAASTTYSSGTDLVMMSAEIIAAPNVPATDRSITMTLDGPLAQSKTSKYTITVGNNGPLTESGPITVVDTLPSVFIVVSAGGSGWSCAIALQRVSCSYTGTLAVGATLPPLLVTVTANANASGAVTNSATVGGALFDYYDGNNTASVSSIIGAALFVPSYMLTDSVCAHNQPFGSASQPCKVVNLVSSTANVEISGLYITYVSAGIPTALSNSASTLALKFALSCHDPADAAGKQASFTSVGTSSNKMPLCLANGAMPTASSSAWSAAANVSFPAGSPSSAVNNKFLYPDVGRIEMYVGDASYRLGSTGAFVSKPGGFVLTASTPGGAANPATFPAAVANPAFVAAGAPFRLSWSAMTGGLVPVVATNFGREKVPATLSLMQAGARDADGAPFPEMVNVPALSGAFGAVSGGSASGAAFAFADVGIVELRLELDGRDYLGAGNVAGTALNVGRFVPDHFETAATGPIVCPAEMACPAAAATMAYSRQPFELRVTAANAAGVKTRNYAGAFARAATLSAWNGAGSAALAQNPPAAPSGSLLAPAAAAASAFAEGVATLAPTYTFPRAYSSAAHRATDLVPPTPVYLRAAESSGGDGVTSARGAASVEGGLTVASGRLLLSNGYGSELIRMPVRLREQYFLSAAAGWRNNDGDTGPRASTVNAAGIAFSRCSKNLLSGSACKSAALGVAGAASIGPLPGTLYLRAPGAGNNGGVDVQMNNPLWLPSTVARLVFGLYRSPLIYVRELY